MSETLLFVYGTLRRGERAHGLLEGARLIGATRTAPGYELRNLGPFPALVSGDGVVSGELYAVARSLLLRLDRYEGDDYRRTAVLLEDGRTAEAYLAGADIAGLGTRIPSGDWFTRR